MQDSRAGVQSNDALNRHLTDKRTKSSAASNAASSPTPISSSKPRALTEPQIRYAQTGKLIDEAVKIIVRDSTAGCAFSMPDLKEDLKCFAARERISYDGDMIQTAVDLALKRAIELRIDFKASVRSLIRASA